VNEKALNHSKQEASCAQTEREQQDQQQKEDAEQRLHQRFACAVKVSVEIPFLPTLKFAAKNFSRSGMFLAFTDGPAAEKMFENNLVSSGSGYLGSE